MDYQWVCTKSNEVQSPSLFENYTWSRSPFPVHIYLYICNTLTRTYHHGPKWIHLISSHIASRDMFHCKYEYLDTSTQAPFIIYKLTLLSNPRSKTVSKVKAYISYRNNGPIEIRMSIMNRLWLANMQRGHCNPLTILIAQAPLSSDCGRTKGQSTCV